MQLNEGVQDSTDEKPITETFKLILEMNKNDIPEYVPVNKYVKDTPGLRRPTKKYAHSAWKPLERYRWITSHPVQRDEYGWNEHTKERWFNKRTKKIQRREKTGKLSRYTLTKTAKNYDELIEWYNLPKLDLKLADENKWDDRDKKEYGVETCWQRSERKRGEIREQLYGKYKYSICKSDHLQKDALKMRNYFKTEAHFLCITDASDEAWRAAAMSPVANYRLKQIFGNAEKFNWKHYDFHPEKEKTSM